MHATIYMYVLILYFTLKMGSSGGVVVELWACETRGPWFHSWFAATIISEIGYLLLQSRDMAERLLKRHKSSKQLTIYIENALINQMCAIHANRQSVCYTCTCIFTDLEFYM